MSLEEFLNEFSFIIKEEYIDDNYYLITTKVINNIDQQQIDSIETKLEINSINKFIKNSNSPVSLTPHNWDMIIDIAKRGQIDFFAINFSIENFFPRNVKTDISFVK